MKSFVKNYSLSIVLFLCFALSWGGQAYFQWEQFVSDQREHAQPIAIREYFNAFGQATLENWQSEFLQLLTMAVLTSFLIHKGSTESKDSEERMERKLNQMRKDIAALKRNR